MLYKREAGSACDKGLFIILIQHIGSCDTAFTHIIKIEHTNLCFKEDITVTRNESCPVTLKFHLKLSTGVSNIKL